MRLPADVFSSTFSNSPSNADVLGATCLIFCAHPPPLGQWLSNIAGIRTKLYNRPALLTLARLSSRAGSLTLIDMVK